MRDEANHPLKVPQGLEGGAVNGRNGDGSHNVETAVRLCRPVGRRFGARADHGAGSRRG